jgi:hypothetical protein
MMRRANALLIGVVLAGCGAQAFDAEFAERQRPALDVVMADLAAAPARETVPVVAAVCRSPAGIVLWDLREARERWRVATDVRSTPIVAGAYVVTTEADGVIVRDVADGSRVHAIGDPDLHLVGADGEGRDAVIALARGQGESPLGVLVGIHDGAGAWSQDLPLPVGTPAVVGSSVVVPWGHQRLSILAMVDGAERLRLHLDHMVVGHAFHRGQRVYVGQHRFVALTPELFSDDRAHASDGIEPAGRPLPGQPPLLPDAYLPRVDADGAGNRVRLAWAFSPPAAEPAGLADDALYFVFYRLVFALAAGADEVRWVRTLPHDVVGVAATTGGLVVASDDGHVTMLAAADGRELLSTELGVELRAADVTADDFVPPAPAATAEADASSLADQLWAAASLSDARLGGGRALAIRFMARDASAEVTEQLIALCSDRTDSSQARGAACDALAERTNGGAAVLVALHSGASFLDARPAPPVGALARAAGSMHLRQALPFLVQHLEDPATPTEELPGIFAGLGALGDARAIAPMERFVRLYHADATDAATLAALGAATTAILTLDADRADELQALASDPLAPEPARQRLTAALTPPAAAPEAPAATPPPPRPTRPPPPPPPDTSLPVSLDSELVETALAPVRTRLLHCLDRPGDADPFPSARMMIMVNDDGAIQTVSVTPAELQTCIEPLVRTRTMPRTRRGDEVVIHTLRR